MNGFLCVAVSGQVDHVGHPTLWYVPTFVINSCTTYS